MRRKLNFNDSQSIERVLNEEVSLAGIDWNLEEIFALKYINDVKGQDTWQSPRVTLQRGGGDCEDLARVTCGALQEAGVKARVQTVRVGPQLRHAVCVATKALPSPYCWLRAEYPYPVDGLPAGSYVYDPSWWGGMPCQPLDMLRRARVEVWTPSGNIGGYEVGKVTSQEEVRRLLPVAANLIKGKPSWTWLWAVMYFETGGTFDPSIQNKQNQATGLIQFVKTTAESMGYTLERLRNMSFQEQLMVPVVTYFNRLGKPMNTLTDVAAGVFYPAGIGKPGFVVGKKGQPTYDLNRALDKNGDEILTIEEYSSRVWEIWRKEFFRPESYYLNAIKGFSPQTPTAELKGLLEDLFNRGLVSAAANQRVAAWIETVRKWGEKWGTLQAIEQQGGFNPQRWAEDKIRGLFQLPRDFSPNATDYVEFIKETATDVQQAASKALDASTIILPAAAVLGALYVLPRVIPRSR